ncbi:hypothetical protein Spb1_38410 [Planctopirus ephydatiae]|uniref:Uncharacterized protein n=1 Tax=Planctopirus ephydatiae TaxID=2528019 RepID=A0A518GTI0_9PLAN|nr:hypothetical protein Spb1_38410 [Planctopirus ephydatiae]
MIAAGRRKPPPIYGLTSQATATGQKPTLPAGVNQSRRVAPVEILISTGMVKPQEAIGRHATPSSFHLKSSETHMKLLPATKPLSPQAHR